MVTLDDTGVIVKASTDSCEVFVVIDDISRLFRFTKAIFYITGKRCAVDLTNVLKFGMNVNVCYKFSPVSEKPFLEAVWLGDKPDLIYPTKSIYNQSGVIRYDTIEHLVVRDDDSKYCVFVHKDGVFPFDKKVVVEKEGSICYDAVMKDNSGTYEATCAWWKNKKPNIYDRFFRYVESDDIIGQVRGVVSVIPEANFAVVNVDTDFRVIKALLMLNNFKGLDVHVGDVLCLRVNLSEVEGRKLWVVVEAQKDGLEIDPPLRGTCKPATSEPILTSADTTKKPICEPPEDVLYDHPPLTGVISKFSSKSDTCCINFKDVKIYVDQKKVYLDGLACTKSNFFYLVSSQMPVHFEAVITDRFGGSSEIRYEAACVWTGEKPSLSVILSQMPAPYYFLKDKKRVYEGIVFQICLPDMALVDSYVGRSIVILLPLAAFSKSKSSWISSFVRVSSRVRFNIDTLPDYPEFLFAVNVEVLGKN